MGVCLCLQFVGFAEEVDFRRDVRPILVQKCFSCHGPDEEERQADLRLDVQAGVFGDPEATTIVRGDPDQSALYQRLTAEDEDLRMPPVDSGKTVSQEERDLVRRWIQEGAKWESHWSHAPPRRHSVPAVADSAWPVNWIDNFVLSRLEAQGLAPAPDADRVTLIRRLSFDLTGLPPTPSEVEQFIKDDSPRAYEQLVDRLLASDRYGERMAIYWLDLVRFADTVGYHGDQDHNISPYRDYVIDAFNENLPFDQFTREQLAGDLLANATEDQKIATGYNRLLQTSHEGGVQAKEYLAIYAADRVRNFSAVWMGATMGCAQCHDHKYDPLSMKDFYSLVAFFADIDEDQHLRKATNALPTQRLPEMKVLSKRQRRRLTEIEARLAELGATLEEPEAEQSDAGAAVQTESDGLREEAQAIRQTARLTMVTQAIEPRTIRILPRGNWLDDSGPVVEPAVPEFLGTLPVGESRLTRLDLANWLTRQEDGVGGNTARIFANRFWYLLFGRGLVPSLDDFGVQSEPPSHPALLDQLAMEFIESGWDVKRMMKRIAMSRTYRQASTVTPELAKQDPHNRWLARQSRFRLPAEMVRDNALAISGLLVLDYGGASIKPYQPAGYYRHLNFPKRTYQTHTDRRQWRRGVYMHWQRQFLHPMLKSLDAPTREECTAERPRSNTPLAALTLLNDPTFVEAARVFAERMMTEGGGDTSSRIDFAFRHAVSRPPDETERTVLTDLFESSLREYEAAPESAAALIRTGQAPRPADGEAATLAAWTTVARALLNLNETITRN